MEIAKRLTRKEKIAQGIPKPKGNRKFRAAEERKEINKDIVSASLNNYPSSPRKMRLLADLIRGKNVEYSLAVLRLSTKSASEPLRKLLLSAINNWRQKFGDTDIEMLIVKTIFVNGGTMLKRVRPAPQGRAYRVRKRSNHVTIILDLPQEKV